MAFAEYEKNSINSTDFSKEIVASIETETPFPFALSDIAAVKSYKNDGILLFAGTPNSGNCRKYIPEKKEYFSFSSAECNLFSVSAALTPNNKYVIVSQDFYLLFDEEADEWTNLNDKIPTSKRHKLNCYANICFDTKNNNLHIICECDHFVVDWDSQLKIMNKLPPRSISKYKIYKLIKGIRSGGFYYNKYDENLYLFGGSDACYFSINSTVYTYSCKQLDGPQPVEWIELSKEHNLAKGVRGFGYEIIDNPKQDIHQIVVVGGSWSGLHFPTDVIQTFDFKTGKWSISNSKLPKPTANSNTVLFGDTLHCFGGYFNEWIKNSDDPTKLEGSHDQHLIIQTKEVHDIKMQKLKELEMQRQKEKQEKELRERKKSERDRKRRYIAMGSAVVIVAVFAFYWFKKT